MTSTNVLPILKTDSKGRVRTPVADREALLDLFEQGGMSGAAFARLHGIRYPIFAHWRSLRRKRLKAATMAPVPMFQEVVLQPAGPQRLEGLVIELPLGARIRLERADQIPLIAALCRHLQENAPSAGGA
jgi:hypothetical protein